MYNEFFQEQTIISFEVVPLNSLLRLKIRYSFFIFFASSSAKSILYSKSYKNVCMFSSQASSIVIRLPLATVSMLGYQPHLAPKLCPILRSLDSLVVDKHS